MPLISVCVLILSLLWPVSASLAQTGQEARTETNCNFGMAKGQTQGSCRVPIPSGCAVAHVPGVKGQRWIDISKGGQTTCQFDPDKTNWETDIVGVCTECKTDHCSARFSVTFSCADNTPTIQMQRPAH